MKWICLFGVYNNEKKLKKMNDEAKVYFSKADIL